MNWISRFLKIQDGISEFLGKAISWLVLVMIGVLVYEIFARYVFNSPTEWAHETTTMLYGTFCVLAGVYTHKHYGHVRSEVVYHLFSLRGRAFLDVITGTFGLVIFGIFFVVVVEFAADSWAAGERSSKSTWAPIIYPFKTVLPIAVALLWLQSLANLIRDFCIAFNLAPPELIGEREENSLFDDAH
ncbi:TRAP transporter small permease subunit [Leucothrix mucor]|jgi:TRAP-type mannitol/chloroaromatic compound transport system permease small subunit|uniref:TRAP transporter small permease subunit n=1 Tax=Leucothrix mucor TaxID=45248 RepID=UPI0003B704A0|nr:TRAP transporter small permease subunit [Leucothrix mucor]